jgi:hypothetical protein
MPKLSPSAPLIHPDCVIVQSTFGAYCEVGSGSRVLQSTFEDYAYCDRLADIANTTVGKFANIAAMTRIGPTDHHCTIFYIGRRIIGMTPLMIRRSLRPDQPVAASLALTPGSVMGRLSNRRSRLVQGR